MAHLFPKRPIKITKQKFSILEVLSRAQIPLSSREIEKQILGPRKVGSKKRNPDTYRIIDNELCVDEANYPFFIFEWNELKNALKELRKFKHETTMTKRVLSKTIENLNMLHLNIVGYEDTNTKTLEWYNDDPRTGIEDVIGLVTCKKQYYRDNDGYDSRIIDVKITIERDKNSKDIASLRVFSLGNETKDKMQIDGYLLRIKHIGKRMYVYYGGSILNPSIAPITYLKPTLKKEIRKEVDKSSVVVSVVIPSSKSVI